jgi:hypothetical protein
MRISLSGIGAAIGAALTSVLTPGMDPGRVYGPRVTASKNLGKSYGIYKRSRTYPAITAGEAPYKRECIRRHKQLLARSQAVAASKGRAS